MSTRGFWWGRVLFLLHDIPAEAPLALLCAAVWAQPAPGQEQPGLLPSPSHGKQGILFRAEPFRGSCSNHQEALLFLGALHKPQVQHNKATQWAVPSVRNAPHSAQRLFRGKKGPGNCLPHPQLRGLKTQQLPVRDTGPPAISVHWAFTRLTVFYYFGEAYKEKNIQEWGL